MVAAVAVLQENVETGSYFFFTMHCDKGILYSRLLSCAISCKQKTPLGLQKLTIAVET